MPVRPDQVPLETAKRWAKRLAKTSQTLDPQRPLALAQCQLAVAQMLGYSHWHALHTALSSIPAASSIPTPSGSLAWNGPTPTTPEQWYAFWHKAVTTEGCTNVCIEMRDNQARVLVRSFGRLLPFANLDRSQATEGVALILPKRSADDFRAHDGKFLGYAMDTVVIPGNTQVERDTVEVRYQSLPVYPAGLDIVLGWRTGRNISLDTMGLPAEVESALLRIARRQGLFVCTGTAGSGRSSLVAALAREFGQGNERQYAVCDSHDHDLMVLHTTSIPVHSHDPQAKHGMVDSLHSAMRADPQTLIIGELRDYHTGNGAWKAAKSGIRVLTTTHSSSRLIERLEDFDKQPWAEVVTGWAQCKLLGVLCQACSTRQANGARTLNPQGCQACRGRGYTGRQLVLDLWEVEQGVPTRRFAAHDQADALVIEGRVDQEDVFSLLGPRH